MRLPYPLRRCRPSYGPLNVKAMVLLFGIVLVVGFAYFTAGAFVGNCSSTSLR